MVRNKTYKTVCALLGERTTELAEARAKVADLERCNEELNNTIQATNDVLARYQDALGDISEALDSVSDKVRLNAIKQIRAVLGRFGC